MKTRILIVFTIALIQSPSWILVYGQEQTFDEFMEWCEPKFGEKCAEFYGKGIFTTSETNNNFALGVAITVVVVVLLGYYFWRKTK